MKVGLVGLGRMGAAIGQRLNQRGLTFKNSPVVRNRAIAPEPSYDCRR